MEGIANGIRSYKTDWTLLWLLLSLTRLSEKRGRMLSHYHKFTNRGYSAWKVKRGPRPRERGTFSLAVGKRPMLKTHLHRAVFPNPCARERIECHMSFTNLGLPYCLGGEREVIFTVPSATIMHMDSSHRTDGERLARRIHGIWISPATYMRRTAEK